jgi:hypothetical protein
MVRMLVGGSGMGSTTALSLQFDWRGIVGLTELVGGIDYRGKSNRRGYLIVWLLTIGTRALACSTLLTFLINPFHYNIRVAI